MAKSLQIMIAALVLGVTGVGLYSYLSFMEMCVKEGVQNWMIPGGAAMMPFFQGKEK